MNNSAAKKRRKSEYEKMHEKCKAYFQPVGELEHSLLDIITRESLRARNLGRLTDAAEETLEHSMMVLRKVQSLRVGDAAVRTPEMRLQ